ncbi:hypothetical protein B7L70_01610 [Vulcanisaeta sp. EB80]|uniref:hypothetical protein n=1 Tax=Vulcanisaeta sp. EB80 TaxID=1650660 RepID=UPI0009C18741|nr:hypothetical protein [Vulcanisaeta sp. EB80]PLC68788.1 hypothetical protein B7L70_01610 [Vulcanisaeta sp. EB80]
MSRVVGLSMVRWDLGVIGYVSATQQGIDTAYSEIFLRCYPTTIDVTREMRGKVACILNVINRGLPMNAVVFFLDPYGIANDVGTKYGVARGVVLNLVYSWFTNYLRSNGFLRNLDVVELNEELKILTPFIKARVGGNASKIAGIIATLVMVRGVDKQKLPISIVDLRNDAEEYVKNTLKKDM